MSFAHLLVCAYFFAEVLPQKDFSSLLVTYKYLPFAILLFLYDVYYLYKQFNLLDAV
jgi:hypothetical protein